VLFLGAFPEQVFFGGLQPHCFVMVHFCHPMSSA
jgi:hypothetical protein